MPLDFLEKCLVPRSKPQLAKGHVHNRSGSTISTLRNGRLFSRRICVVVSVYPFEHADVIGQNVEHKIHGCCELSMCSNFYFSTSTQKYILRSKQKRYIDSCNVTNAFIASSGNVTEIHGTSVSMNSYLNSILAWFVGAIWPWLAFRWINSPCFRVWILMQLFAVFSLFFCDVYSDVRSESSVQTTTRFWSTGATEGSENSGVGTGRPFFSISTKHGGQDLNARFTLLSQWTLGESKGDADVHHCTWNTFQIVPFCATA